MDMWRRTVGLVLALAVLTALSVLPAHAQTLMETPTQAPSCQTSFVVAAHEAVVCSFAATPNEGVIYQLNSTVNVSAAIVAPAYLDQYNSAYGPAKEGWAAVSATGSGTLLNGMLYDTGNTQYYLVVQDSGGQDAEVRFQSYPIKPPPLNMIPSVNVSVPPGSAWCLPLQSPFGLPAQILGFANATVAYAVTNSSATVFQSPYATATNYSSGGISGYILNLQAGNYTLMIKNPHQYAAFTVNLISIGGVFKTLSGTPCGATTTSTTTTTSTATSTATSTSTTSTSTATSTGTSSVSTVTVTATPQPNTLASPALLVAVAALVVAVVLAVYVFLGRRGASGGGGGAQAT